MPIVGRTEDSSWWQVETDTGVAWIAASVTRASNTEEVPVVEAPVPAQPEEPPPAQPAAVCVCSADVYNCSDFGTQGAAQACFDYCRSIGRGDVHGLDRDDDGRVCESLP